MRKSLLVLPAILLLFISPLSIVPAAFAQSNSGPPSCPSNEIFHITQPGGIPTNFNSLLAYNTGFEVAYSVYKQLNPRFAPSGVPIAGRSLTDLQLHNTNYTQWTFHIAPNQTWSNGQPVTAQDVVNTYSPSFALNKTYDPVPLGPEIQSVNEINSSTVVFNLTHPDAWFPAKASPPIDTIVYPQSYTEHGAAWDGFGTQVTDGPWYIYNYTAGSSQMIMYRNPYYQPQPSICEIVWNFVETAQQDPTYILSGASDFAPVSPNVISSLSSNPNVHIYNNPGFQVTYLAYNITEYPFNMTQFREALAYGINQTQLLQQGLLNYGATGYNAEGGVPALSKYFNPNQQAYSYNQSKALDLLSSIGITKGSNGQLQYKNGTGVSFTIWAENDQYPWDPTLAGLIQSDLQSLGFTIQVQSAAYTTLVGYLVANSNDVQHAMLLSSTNGVDFGDPLVDALPGRTTYVLPGYTFGSTWEWPPSAQQSFQGNLTALENTQAPAQVTQDIGNIQAINAQNLPNLVLLYADTPYAFSTAHWSNWPSGNTTIFGVGQVWNSSAMLQLQAVAGTSTAQSTSGVASSSSSQATSAVATSSSAIVASSSTGSSGGLTNLSLNMVAEVLAVIVIAAAIVALRRRKDQEGG